MLKNITKNYLQLKIQIRPEMKFNIASYAEKNNLSIAKFIQNACQYCIDNNITFDDK